MGLGKEHSSRKDRAHKHQRREVLKNLLRDPTFVDYFNVFLNLPVFGQRALLKQHSKVFTFCPPVAVRMHNHRVLDWIQEERYKAFMKTRLAHEFQLVHKLLKVSLSFRLAGKDANKGSEDKELDKDGTDKEALASSPPSVDLLHVLCRNLVGNVAGMYLFREYLRGTSGARVVACWMHVQAFRKTRDPERRVELFRSIRRFYLHPVTLLNLNGDGDDDRDGGGGGSGGSEKCWTDIVAPDLLNFSVVPVQDREWRWRIRSSRERPMTAQELDPRSRKALAHVQHVLVLGLQSYWLPCYILHVLASQKLSILKDLFRTSLDEKVDTTVIQNLVRRCTLLHFPGREKGEGSGETYETSSALQPLPSPFTSSKESVSTPPSTPTSLVPQADEEVPGYRVNLTPLNFFGGTPGSSNNSASPSPAITPESQEARALEEGQSLQEISNSSPSSVCNARPETSASGAIHDDDIDRTNNSSPAHGEGIVPSPSAEADVDPEGVVRRSGSGESLLSPTDPEGVSEASYRSAGENSDDGVENDTTGLDTSWNKAVIDTSSTHSTHPTEHTQGGLCDESRSCQEEFEQRCLSASQISLSQKTDCSVSLGGTGSAHSRKGSAESVNSSSSPCPQTSSELLGGNAKERSLSVSSSPLESSAFRPHMLETEGISDGSEHHSLYTSSTHPDDDSSTVRQRSSKHRGSQPPGTIPRGGQHCEVVSLSSDISTTVKDPDTSSSHPDDDSSTVGQRSPKHRGSQLSSTKTRSSQHCEVASPSSDNSTSIKDPDTPSSHPDDESSTVGQRSSTHRGSQPPSTKPRGGQHCEVVSLSSDISTTRKDPDTSSSHPDDDNSTVRKRSSKHRGSQLPNTKPRGSQHCEVVSLSSDNSTTVKDPDSSTCDTHDKTTVDNESVDHDSSLSSRCSGLTVADIAWDSDVDHNTQQSTPQSSHRPRNPEQNAYDQNSHCSPENKTKKSSQIARTSVRKQEQAEEDFKRRSSEDVSSFNEVSCSSAGSDQRVSDGSGEINKNYNKSTRSVGRVQNPLGLLRCVFSDTSSSTLSTDDDDDLGSEKGLTLDTKDEDFETDKFERANRLEQKRDWRRRERKERKLKKMRRQVVLPAQWAKEEYEQWKGEELRLANIANLTKVALHDMALKHEEVTQLNSLLIHYIFGARDIVREDPKTDRRTLCLLACESLADRPLRNYLVSREQELHKDYLDFWVAMRRYIQLRDFCGAGEATSRENRAQIARLLDQQVEHLSRSFLYNFQSKDGAIGGKGGLFSKGLRRQLLEDLKNRLQTPLINATMDVVSNVLSIPVTQYILHDLHVFHSVVLRAATPEPPKDTRQPAEIDMDSRLPAMRVPSALFKLAHRRKTAWGFKTFKDRRCLSDPWADELEAETALKDKPEAKHAEEESLGEPHRVLAFQYLVMVTEDINTSELCDIRDLTEMIWSDFGSLHIRTKPRVRNPILRSLMPFRRLTCKQIQTLSRITRTMLNVEVEEADIPDDQYDETEDTLGGHHKIAFGFSYDMLMRLRQRRAAVDMNRPPRPRCFNDLLYDDYQHSFFRLYLISQGPGHIDALSFWKACEKAKNTYDVEERGHLFNVIKFRYLLGHRHHNLLLDPEYVFSVGMTCHENPDALLHLHNQVKEELEKKWWTDYIIKWPTLEELLNSRVGYDDLWVKQLIANEGGKDYIPTEQGQLAESIQPTDIRGEEEDLERRSSRRKQQSRLVSKDALLSFRKTPSEMPETPALRPLQPGGTSSKAAGEDKEEGEGGTRMPKPGSTSGKDQEERQSKSLAFKDSLDNEGEELEEGKDGQRRKSPKSSQAKRTAEEDRRTPHILIESPDGDQNLKAAQVSPEKKAKDQEEEAEAPAGLDILRRLKRTPSQTDEKTATARSDGASGEEGDKEEAKEKAKKPASKKSTVEKKGKTLSAGRHKKGKQSTEPEDEKTRRKRRRRVMYRWARVAKVINAFTSAVRDPIKMRLFEDFLRRELEQAQAKNGSGPFCPEKPTYTRLGLTNIMLMVNKLPADLRFWVEVDRFKKQAMNAQMSAQESTDGELVGEDSSCHDHFLNIRAGAIIDCFLSSVTPPMVQINIPDQDAFRITATFTKSGLTPGLFHLAFMRLTPVLINYWKQYQFECLKSDLAKIKSRLEAPHIYVGDLPHPLEETPSYTKCTVKDYQNIYVDRNDTHAKGKHGAGGPAAGAPGALALPRAATPGAQMDTLKTPGPESGRTHSRLSTVPSSAQGMKDVSPRAASSRYRDSGDIKGSPETGKEEPTSRLPEGRLMFSMVSGIHVLQPVTGRQREKEKMAAEKTKVPKEKPGEKTTEKDGKKTKEKEEGGKAKGKEEKEKERGEKAKKEEEKAEGKKKLGFGKMAKETSRGEATSEAKTKDQDVSDDMMEMRDVVKAKLSEFRGAKANLKDVQESKSKPPSKTEQIKSPSIASRVNFSRAGSPESRGLSIAPSIHPTEGLKKKAVRDVEKATTLPALVVEQRLSPRSPKALVDRDSLFFPTVMELERAFRDPALLQPRSRPTAGDIDKLIPVFDDAGKVMPAKRKTKPASAAGKSPSRKPKSKSPPLGAIRLNDPNADKGEKKEKKAKAPSGGTKDTKKEKKAKAPSGGTKDTKKEKKAKAPARETKDTKKEKQAKAPAGGTKDTKAKKAKGQKGSKQDASSVAKKKRSVFAPDKKLAKTDKSISQDKTSVLQGKKGTKDQQGIMKKKSQGVRETLKKDKDKDKRGEGVAAGVARKTLSMPTAKKGFYQADVMGEQIPRIGQLVHTLGRHEIKLDQILGPAALTMAMQPLPGAVQASWGVWGGVVGGHPKMGQESEGEVVKQVSTMVEQLLRSRLQRQRKMKKKGEGEEFDATSILAEKDEEEEEEEEEEEATEEYLRVLRRLREQEETGKRILQVGVKISPEDIRGRLSLEGEGSLYSSTAFYKMEERRVSARSRQAVYGDTYQSGPRTRVTTPDMAETQKVGKRKRKRPLKCELQCTD